PPRGATGAPHARGGRRPNGRRRGQRERMTRATRSAFGTPAGGGGTSGADHCAREGCERRIDITQHPNTASNAEESDTMFVKLTQETLAMMGRLGTITQDTLNRVRNLGRGHDNFIPIDLRNRLDADADQADRNGDRACAAIVEAEPRREVARYAEPVALTELLAHLADPQDPSFGPCRQAVVRVYRRVGPGAGEPCGIIRDSESRLAELITGKGLEKHDAHTEQLGFICAHVGLTPAGQPLEGIEQQLGAIAAHVAGVEAGF